MMGKPGDLLAGHIQFQTTVLRPASLGIVGGYGTVLTITRGRDPFRRHFLADEHFLDRVRAIQRKSPVRFGRAGVVGVSH